MQSFKNDLSSADIEKSIFATIAYYDYFNYPLTAGEIYQYLIRPRHNNVIASPAEAGRSNPVHSAKSAGLRSLFRAQRGISGHVFAERFCDKFDRFASASPRNRFAPRNDSERSTFSEIIEILDNSQNLKNFIEQKNGFYFLRGREEIIKQRIQKKKLMDQKYKKVKWILRFISYLPFVRLIMLSGSMGLGNPLKESDIDLLVVAKHGRIWTTRAILTFFTLLFGVYRHTGKTQNRLCLNHYITDRSLGIDFGNLYKAQEYLNLLPLAGDLNIYKDFFKENIWIKDYAYSASGSLENNLRTVSLKGIPLRVKKFFEFLFSSLFGENFEKYAKKLQVFFIEKNPLTKSPHARIRYDDGNLVFHPVLVEPKVISKWEEKMAKFDN